MWAWSVLRLVQARHSGKGLRQDFETGCPKLAIVNFFVALFFRGRPQCTLITSINMYLIIEMRHDILIQQCHGNYIEEEKLKVNAYY